MNVLEAIEKIDDLKEKIDTLNHVFVYLDSDSRGKKDAHHLNEIKSRYADELRQLERRLEQTQLVNLR